MNKYFLYLILFIIFNQCSLDTKTGFWTKPEILKEKKENLVEIFKTEEVLEKEFNPNLKIKINSLYTQKPFINNLTNNSGYINFESNLNEISKFKFKKIKNFDFINPDLLIGNDNSLTFFDEKGASCWGIDVSEPLIDIAKVLNDDTQIKLFHGDICNDLFLKNFENL